MGKAESRIVREMDIALAAARTMVTIGRPIAAARFFERAATLADVVAWLQTAESSEIERVTA